MILLRPDYLIFMMIPTFILFFFILRSKSGVDAVFDKEMIAKLTFDNGTLGRMGRNFLLFASIVFMILALSRPAIEKGDIKIKSKKIDLLVALDISKSMLATDLYPNRLTFAKKKIYELIDSFKEANIGIVAFSSEGFLVSPMTQDSTTLKYLLNNLSLESLTSGGTDLLIPIDKAATFLKKSKQKIVIIFTDGGDNETFEKELQAAKDADEHIYIYATATAVGSPIPDKSGSLKDKEGNIVITKLNDKIKTLAIESGGAYIVGGLKDDSIKLLVEDIKKKFEMQEGESRDIKEYKELFYYPLSLAILFMLFAFSSLPKRNALVLLLLLNMGDTSLKAGMLDFQIIDKANQAYKDKNYKQAIESYKKVLKSKQSPQSKYDLANALYKDKKYKQALHTYNQISSKDKNLEYKKLFNTANTQFQLKKYEDALKTYEKAQKIKNEEDLEHNIAVTKKMIEKKKKQNKKDKKNKKDKNKEKEKKEDKQNQQDKQKNKQDKKEKDAKDGDKDKKPSKQQNQANKPKEEKISEKEAKKWEQQLEKMKPKTMPMKFQQQPAKRRQIEKPW